MALCISFTSQPMTCSERRGEDVCNGHATSDADDAVTRVDLNRHSRYCGGAVERQ